MGANEHGDAGCSDQYAGDTCAGEELPTYPLTFYLAFPLDPHPFPCDPPGLVIALTHRGF
ncbi:hypothetical protein GCM10010524_11150 [Streptomyces mexicanus]